MVAQPSMHYQAEIIRSIGPENVVIGSDFGPQLFVPHVEGLRLMIRYFIDYGFSKEEISMMFKGGAKLLGLT